MDIPAFLGRLAEIKDGFDWVLRPNGVIRGFAKPDKFKYGMVSVAVCPITAMYLSTFDRCVSVLGVTDAADAMDISRRDAWTIIVATDNGSKCDHVLRKSIWNLLKPNEDFSMLCLDYSI